MPLLQIYSPFVAILRAAKSKSHPFLLQAKKLNDLEERFGNAFQIGGHASKEGLQTRYKELTEEIKRREAGNLQLEKSLAHANSEYPEVKEWKKEINTYNGTLKYVALEISKQYEEILKKKYTDKNKKK